MDQQSAKRFKTHISDAIGELSSAILVSQNASSNEEFIIVRQSVGDIIARVDNLLKESIHIQHPDLDDL